MIRSSQKIDTILFDIDGVLVDVRQSYIDSIRKAVEIYLEKILLVRPAAHSLLSRKDVHQFKLLGGFNNDWDTVYGLLLYFQFLAEKNKKSWDRCSFNDLARLKKIGRLTKQMSRPCGIPGIKRLVKAADWISYQLGKDIFQEIYLGPALLAKDEKRKPLFHHGKGLIGFEKLLIPRPVLQSLKRRGIKFGIVTGRTAFEADYVLKRFGIRKFFEAVVTHDQVAREEKKQGRVLRKPHPFSVLLCARKTGGKSFLYVGDLPDDIRAANAAKKKIRILSSGVLYGQAEPALMKKEFKNAQADLILTRPAGLLKYAAVS